MSMNVQVLHLNDRDHNAVFTNTKGSYTCRCRRGQEGDDSNCTGIQVTSDRVTLIAFHQTFTKFLLCVRNLLTEPSSKINVGKKYAHIC